MAAATVESNKLVIHGGMLEQHTVLSSLTSDQTETLTLQTAYGAPNKVAPLNVSFEQLVASSTGAQLQCEHILASDSTSGNTISCKFRVGPHEDISGAKVKVIIRWLNSSRQDGNSISSDNNT